MEDSHLLPPVEAKLVPLEPCSALPNDPLQLEGSNTRGISIKTEANNDALLQKTSLFHVDFKSFKAETSIATPFDDWPASVPCRFNGTDDLMTAILGDVPSSLDLSVSLNSEVFAAANREASLSVFPVLPRIYPCSTFDHSRISPPVFDSVQSLR